MDGFGLEIRDPHSGNKKFPVIGRPGIGTLLYSYPQRFDKKLTFGWKLVAGSNFCFACFTSVQGFAFGQE